MADTVDKELEKTEETIIEIVEPKAKVNTIASLMVIIKDLADIVKRNISNTAVGLDIDNLKSKLC